MNSGTWNERQMTEIEKLYSLLQGVQQATEASNTFNAQTKDVDDGYDNWKGSEEQVQDRLNRGKWRIDLQKLPIQPRVFQKPPNAGDVRVLLNRLNEANKQLRSVLVTSGGSVKTAASSTGTPAVVVGGGIFIAFWVLSSILATLVQGVFGDVAWLKTTDIVSLFLGVGGFFMAAVVGVLGGYVYMDRGKKVRIRLVRTRCMDWYENKVNLEKGYNMWKEQSIYDSRPYIEHIKDAMQALNNQYAAMTRFGQEVNRVSPPWGAPSWQTWAPPSEMLGVIRFGQAKFGDASFPMQAPIMFSESLAMIAGDAHTQREIVAATQGLVLRAFASVPPGKLRCVFLDPVGSGQNAAPFLQLEDYDPELIGLKVWTKSGDIDKQLAMLTEHMETVIQKYLRNDFSNIHDYNQQAGEMAEPIRLLVIFDFPSNFSQQAAQNLISILQNGPRCGIFTIIAGDTETEMPYGMTVEDIINNVSFLFASPNGLEWENLPDTFELTLDGIPDDATFNHILQQVGEQAEAGSEVVVPFKRIAPAREDWWSTKCDTQVDIPIGPTGARKLLDFSLGLSTNQHAMVVGKTGSGKSTLLHVLILNAALHYSPDELELYLIDFKEGVEFKTYATHELPHARVVAIQTEREFGLSVLRGLDAERERRGELFRSMGIENLTNYRAQSPQRMPRIMLIADEFQEFFTQDDNLSTEAAQILDRLVRQGRAFGIHVLLVTQTLAGRSSISRSTKDQMGVRMAFQCSDADSRLILADDNGAARTLSRPGEAIYNTANGMVEGNNPVQVAWLSKEERDDYLTRIFDHARDVGYTSKQPQIVFEGNAPSHVEKNEQLYTALRDHSLNAPMTLDAWLGDPIAIADAVKTRFRRMSGNNLLIVGRDSDLGLGMNMTTLLSLAAHIPVPDKAGLSPFQKLEDIFYICDLSIIDGDDIPALTKLAQSLPHPTRISRQRRLPLMLEELAEIVKERIDREDYRSAPKVMIINGLQRARNLREDDSMGMGFGADDDSDHSLKNFKSILQDGPEVGVHTIIWCDSVTNLNRVMNRRMLREFSTIVGMRMSAEDSTTLIDSPAANKLKKYGALLYDEESGKLVKFRPYAPPVPEWVDWACKRMAGAEVEDVKIQADD